MIVFEATYFGPDRTRRGGGGGGMVPIITIRPRTLPLRPCQDLPRQSKHGLQLGIRFPVEKRVNARDVQASKNQLGKFGMS